MLRKVRDFDGDYLDDLKGTNLYGPDQEKLGSIDDAIVDDRTGNLHYFVVDAGWLSTRKFLVPADQVYAFGNGDDLFVNLRKPDVETLPEYREDVWSSDDSFATYETRYRGAWHYEADPARVRPSNSIQRFRTRIRERFARLKARETSGVPAASYVSPGLPRPMGVYGVYGDRKHVESAIEKLREGGFNSSDISAVFPEANITREFALEKNTKAPEGALAGGGTGFVIGGALGWLAGIGTLAIPGIGPLLAAGPIVAAIAGAGVGSAIGGIAGALIGLGLPEIEAKRFEEEIKRGRILVSVHCENAHLAQKARKILDDSGAKDVFLSGERLAA